MAGQAVTALSPIFKERRTTVFAACAVAVVLYATLRFGLYAGTHIAILAVLFFGFGKFQSAFSAALRAILVMLLIGAVFAIAFAPAPWGLGSIIPAAMM